MTQEREDFLVQRALEAQAAEKAAKEAKKAARNAARAAARAEARAAEAQAATEPPQTAAEPQRTEQQTAGTEPHIARNYSLKLQFNDGSKLEFYFNSEADTTTVVQEIAAAITTAYEFSNLRLPNGKRSCTKKQILSGSRFKLSYFRENKEIKTVLSDSTHTNQALQYNAWLEKVISLILNTQRSDTLSVSR